MNQAKSKKTALVLGGGGSRGAYEVGVWKALSELGIQFDLVVGTSVGAINGAMAAQGKLDLAVELWELLTTDMVFGLSSDSALAYAREALAKGGAETSGLQRLLEQYIDEDAVRASRVDFGLVTVEVPNAIAHPLPALSQMRPISAARDILKSPRRLPEILPSLKAHRLMKDDIEPGKLIPFIMASSACFPAAQGKIIDDKTYIDGAYHDNLPVAMALENGAERIIAVDLQATGIVRKRELAKAEEGEIDFTLIRSDWDLGNTLVFQKETSKMLIDLGYRDTMRTYGMYTGRPYKPSKSQKNLRKRFMRKLRGSRRVRI
ncbi:MAG: patatin-like phospholipase family protein [Clostridiales Family XIII bacterium]|jgi:NTE family protein|nr:patatin-like phospholipase family protein [Clostridiales Family XIII bacterium]